MSLFFEFFAALAAGLLSFLSPCVFPLIPSYLAMLSGASVKDLKESTGEHPVDEHRRQIRRIALFRSLAFSLGFTSVFVILGLLFSQASAMIGTSGRIWEILAGLVIILLGLDTMFDFINFLRIEKRFQIQRRPQGYVSAFLFGAAFGAGWSPCVGPMLASILFLAGSGSLGKAGLLLATYSLGLAIPFILTSLFLGSLQGLLQRLKEHLGAVKLFSGLILISIGLYMIVGDLRQLTAGFTRLGFQMQSSADSMPLVYRIVTSLFLLISAVLLFFWRHPSGKSRTLPRNMVVLFLLGLAVLEALGVISLIRIIAGWMLFQGI